MSANTQTKAIILLVQNEIVNNSDGEDEDNFVIFKMLHNSRTKISNFVEEIIPMYLENDFKQHLRINKTTFQSLLLTLGRYCSYGRPPISIEKEILITLWYLGNQEVCRSNADRFGMSKSSAREVIYRLCDKLIQLRGNFIRWPTRAEATSTCNYFRNKNDFFGIIGLIDGRHIPICRPKQLQESYVNRKGFHSLVLQGVCNEKEKFIDVSCGWPGSMHDARVFRRTELGEIIENHEQFYNTKHLIGDSAYPLFENLLVPYRDNGNLTGRQRNFNRKLSENRIYIEHAFGLLKQRFRLLRYVNIYKTEYIPKIILSTCILHNICMDQGDYVEEEIFVDNDYENDVVDNGRGNRGVAKRNYLAEIL